MGLKGLELVSKLRATPVTHPEVDGHEEGFCVKIVKGVLSVAMHSTPSFFTSLGARSSSITQVATYKTLARRLKLWAKMKPQTLSTKPWRVVA